MMKAVVVKGPRYRDVSCRVCHTFPTAGQVILVDRLANVDFGSRDYIVHKTCIQRIVEAAPTDRDELAFQALRDRIIETRTPFPRVM